MSDYPIQIEITGGFFVNRDGDICSFPYKWLTNAAHALEYFHRLGVDGGEIHAKVSGLDRVYANCYDVEKMIEVLFAIQAYNMERQPHAYKLLQSAVIEDMGDVDNEFDNELCWEYEYEAACERYAQEVEDRYREEEFVDLYGGRWDRY